LLTLSINIGCTKSSPSPIGVVISSTRTSTLEVSKQCLTVQDTFDQANSTKGRIVLDGLFNINILHLPTLEEKPLPRGTNDVLSNPSVSPDAKSLAYIHTEYDEDGKLINSQLLVTTVEGEPQVKIPCAEGWGSIWGWLDNSR
jgi:hypothetical protein